MFYSLEGFDPLLFLNIPEDSFSSKQEVAEIKKYLLEEMGSYVFTKLTKQFTDTEIERMMPFTSGDKLLQKLSLKISDLEEKMLGELENYKREFVLLYGNT